MKQLKVITWASWRIPDHFSPDHFTIFTAFILKPSWEYPVACAAMSIRKGNHKIFLRMPFKALRDTFVIPDEYLSRLMVANHEAEAQAHIIREQQKAFHRMAGVQDASGILDEAEKILKEREKQNE